MHINNGHGGIKKSFKTGMFKAVLFLMDILDTVGVMVQSNQGLKAGLHQAGVSALTAGICRQIGKECAVANPERIVNQGYQ